MKTEVIISKNISIKKCFEILNRTAKKTLIVTDSNKKLLGTLSSGDIRKALLKKKNLSSKIENIYKKKCVSFYEDNIPSIKKIKDFFLKTGLDLIPIIDKNEKIVKIIFPNSILELKKAKISNFFYAVIMAGGLGTRLQPFTHILPKPLMPINKKPIIEHIINKIKRYEPKNIFITVNYKSKILKAFFDELKPRLSVKLIFEKILQGTCGGLQKIKFKKNYPILLCNCDNYFNFDIQKIINHHLILKNDITVIVAKKVFNIPYGVCEYDKNHILNNLTEKPSYSFFVNTGIYVLNKELIKFIPSKKKFDTTDLIKKATFEKKKVGIYKINSNAWKDIGNWKSFLN
jgi:dTDP-glucose pyrophosphorylase